MTLANRIGWIGFIVAVACLIFGVTQRDTRIGDTLIFVGYVMGFPFLMMPLVVLAQWSQSRQKKKTSEGTKKILANKAVEGMAPR